MLSGELPKMLSELKALKILHLNNNSFTGCIDSSLVKLCTKLHPTYNKNEYISDGNQLSVSWETYCETGNDDCVLACATDWDALKQLYLSTDGENWTFRQIGILLC